MARLPGVDFDAELDRGELGLALVVVAVVGLSTVLGLGAATAPSQEVTGFEETRTLVGVQGGGIGYHEHGSVQLLDHRGEPRWTIENADSYFDVTWMDDGSVMAGFMDSGYEDCGPYPAPCTHTGFRILDPDAADPVRYEHSYPVRTASNSETHDVERLPTGEFVVTDMEHERIYTLAPNGTTTWEWRASSVYEPPPDPTRTDWLHINDVDALGEDLFLVSVRNANQLVIVERGTGVVDVVNEDGDPDLLFQQHNPQWLAENAILVADSENDRVVELHRNGTDGEWFVAWALEEANGLPFSWPRDADRLDNGNTLVTDSRNTRIVEVQKNGSVVWSTTLEYIPYEAERLPVGETAGGRVYNPESGGIETGRQDRVPVLTPLLSLLKAGYPLPYWLGEWHLLTALVSLALVVSGSGLWIGARRRQDHEQR